MQPDRRRIGRDMGYAIAALAIYLLTLMLPLHQAAGLQRDLDRLGFANLGAVSVCSPGLADPDGDPDTPNALKCAAAGIGKHDVAAVLPPALSLTPPRVAVSLAYLPAYKGPLPRRAPHYAQARAPPVAV